MEVDLLRIKYVSLELQECLERAFYLQNRIFQLHSKIQVALRTCANIAEPAWETSVFILVFYSHSAGLHTCMCMLSTCPAAGGATVHICKQFGLLFYDFCFCKCNVKTVV